MGLLSRLSQNGDAQAEQLGPDDPAPRGESRDDGGFLISLFGTSSRQTTSTITTTATGAPGSLTDDYETYCVEFGPARASLQIFTDTVLEPGYHISVTRDGDPDEKMQEALRTWAANCVIRANETGQDLVELLDDLVKLRRGRGTEFVEKVGTESDPDALAALMLHKPETFKQLTRDDQSIIVQPNDAVEPEHPRTPDDEAAAYVQYHDSLGFHDEDAIAFAVDDIIKFVYDPMPGSGWGTPITDTIGPRIDALTQKWDDRDAAIHQTGHPHRIYSSESWTNQQAQEYADLHDKGEVSAWDDDEDEGTWAGRVDFVSSNIEVTTEQGSVADISDAVKDDIETIFSVLPTSKFKIAYAEDINQFVVEPQDETDERLIDNERRYLEKKFRPVFEEKADELAGGSYDGEITFRIEPGEDDNPLMRESFPAENLTAMADAWAKWKQTGLAADLPAPVFAEMQGFDLEEFAEKHGWTPEELEAEVLDEETEAAQDQIDAIAEANQEQANADDGEEAE